MAAWRPARIQPSNRSNRAGACARAKPIREKPSRRASSRRTPAARRRSGAFTSGMLASAQMGESRFWTRVFAAAGAAVLLYLLARILRPFLGPILWASLLAFLLFPVNRALRRRLPNRRGLVSLLLTVAVTLGIVIPTALLMLVFFRQATDLLSRFSQLATRYQIERPQDLLKIPALGRIVEWVDRKTPVSAAELQEFLVNGARHGLELLLPAGRQVLLTAFGAVVGLLLMLFILYFFFRDGDNMAQ